MTVEETLESVVARFNRHLEKTPALAEELRGLRRTVSVRLTDGTSYSVDLAEGRLAGLRPGAEARADLTITTDPATFEGLVRKEIGPMKALVTRRLKIDGSLEDKLLFRKLL